MKRVFLVLALVLVTGLTVTFLTKKSSKESQKKNLANDSLPARSKIKEKGMFLRENKNTKREGIEEAAQLLETFNEAANQDKASKFRSALSSLLSRNFTGDPEAILNLLTPYLKHENKEIRYELAKTYLWAGLQNKRATKVLTDFVDDENNKPVEKELLSHPSETYIEDYQKKSAKLLTTYRVKEAIDPMWRAYEQTQERSYLRLLSIFRDPRVIDEAVRLVEEKKSKYSDLHEVFGRYKVEQAAKPLESVFRARQERYPKKNQSQLAWTLYQITEKQDYYNYLVERESYVNNTLLEIPNVLKILEKTLRSDDGSNLNARGNQAFLSLLVRKGGREIVERYLVDVFEEKIRSPLDATLRYQVSAHLDSGLVNAAAQRYEEKYSNGLWPHYSKRKRWPIKDLLDGLDY